MKNLIWGFYLGTVLFSNIVNAAPDAGDTPAIQQRNITLSSYSYTSFPEAYCNVRNVERIEIAKNDLTSLPSCIARFGKTLRMLTIRDNAGLTTLPPEIGSQVFLETLRINTSGLTTIPPQINGAKNLRTLDLQGNKIDSLPREIGDLATLETLNLNNNSLVSSALPDEIGQLTSLHTLDLSNNKLTKAPIFLAYLVNLTTINFAGNNLSDGEKEVIKAIFKERPTKEAATKINF